MQSKNTFFYSFFVLILLLLNTTHSMAQVDGGPPPPPEEDNRRPDEAPIHVIDEETVNKANDTTIFTIVERRAVVLGLEDDGQRNNWLKSNLIYPAEAKAKNIEGKVFVKFIVEKDGTTGSFEVLRSPDPSLNAEAIRLVKYMGKWQPGANKFGTEIYKPVRTYYILPISFKLE